MKKTVLFAVLIFSLAFTPPLLSQEKATESSSFNLDTPRPLTDEEIEEKFNYEKAYQDYIYNYDLYLNAHKEYLIAKNQYETYGTLASRALALEQTKDMLQKRDETIATFLTALRLKMAQDTNIANSTLNSLYVQLDKETQWFRDYKKKYPSAGSISDLVGLTKEPKGHYPKTQSFIYQSLLEILIFKEDLIHQKVQTLLNNTEKLISRLREEDVDTSTLERWLLDAKNKKKLGSDKFDQASGYRISAGDKLKEMKREYYQAIAQLELSHQYLKECNTHLEEIIIEIKTEIR